MTLAFVGLCLGPGLARTRPYHIGLRFHGSALCFAVGGFVDRGVARLRAQRVVVFGHYLGPRLRCGTLLRYDGTCGGLCRIGFSFHGVDGDFPLASQQVACFISCGDFVIILVAEVSWTMARDGHSTQGRCARVHVPSGWCIVTLSVACICSLDPYVPYLSLGVLSQS